jgi:hypothetical protein
VSLTDFMLGPKVRISGTTWAAEVLGFRGKSIQKIDRWTATPRLFKTDRMGGHPYERPDDVLANLLEFAWRPVITWEHPVDIDGQIIDPTAIEGRIKRREQGWDASVVFPRESCDVPRLRFTDMVGLEMIRRFAADHNIGVIFASATFSPDDRELMCEMWPDLAERSHPYPERRIQQLAIIAPDGHYGPGGLVTKNGRLVTAPLESVGRGLVFLATRTVANWLYAKVCPNQPSVSFVDGGQVEWRNRHAVHNEAETKTLLTYSRGVLGRGANLPSTRFLLLDCLAFRAIASFTPGKITPKEFEEARAQERMALITQNVGRLLRGEEGKTAVLFLLNAEPELVQAIASSPAVVDGCELSPVVVTGNEMTQLVDQARRWLEAGGGDWPGPDHAMMNTKKKGRKPTPTSALLVRVDQAIKEGMSWREFSQKCKPQRHFNADQLKEIKQRFSDKRL